MARQFDIPGFKSHLLEVMARAPTKQGQTSLRLAATVVWKEAQSAIGQDNWEPGAPFLSPWPDLADSTQEDKTRRGYVGKVSEFDSLLRTGEVKRSIKWKIHPDKKGFSVGSNNPVATMLELGTKKMPPRSFLGGALVRTKKKVGKLLGEGLYKALVGEEVHEGALEIEGEDQ